MKQTPMSKKMKRQILAAAEFDLRSIHPQRYWSMGVKALKAINGDHLAWVDGNGIGHVMRLSEYSHRGRLCRVMFEHGSGHYKVEHWLDRHNAKYFNNKGNCIYKITVTPEEATADGFMGSLIKEHELAMISTLCGVGEKYKFGVKSIAWSTECNGRSDSGYVYLWSKAAWESYKAAGGK